MELIVTSVIGGQTGQVPHGLQLVKVQETVLHVLLPFPELWLVATRGILTNLASNCRGDNKLHVFIQPEYKKRVFV